MNDLSQEAVERATVAWSPEARFVEVAESTNLLAAEWASEGAAEGCIVVANHQTAGRGRLDRSWFAPQGTSLLFSMILRPRLGPDAGGLVGLAAAAAACHALETWGIEARVKWPNDVLISGRKVSGILAEMHTSEGQMTSLILGMGVNVNIEEKDFPEDLRYSATSLLIAANRRFDRAEVLVTFLGAFGFMYSLLSPRMPERFLDKYRPLCETLGKRVSVQTGDLTLESTAVDIDVLGGLILDSGQVVRAGDVIHVR